MGRQKVAGVQMVALRCMQDNFARVTHSAGRPRARNDRVFCIQIATPLGVNILVKITNAYKVQILFNFGDSEKNVINKNRKLIFVSQTTATQLPPIYNIVSTVYRCLVVRMV